MIGGHGELMETRRRFAFRTTSQLGLVALLGVLAINAAQAAIAPGQAVATAQRELRAGRFEAAAVALADAATRTPLDAARLALARAELAYYRGFVVAEPTDTTLAELRAALLTAEGAGDRALVAKAQDLLALALFERNFRATDHAESRALLDAALTARRALEGRCGVAESLFHLGLTYEHPKDSTAADTARAGELYRESLATAQASGCGYEASYAERHLAGQADDRGDLVAARTGFERSLAQRRKSDATLVVAPALVALADVISKQGDLERARALYEEAVQVARKIPAPRFEAPAAEALATLGRAPRLAGPAVLVLPDLASTEGSEVRISRSPDGRWAVWGSTDRAGGPGGWEIWIADCAEAPCETPRPASIDSSANDFDPAFASDGKTIYFFSNRPGGLGGDDLYTAPFDPATGNFGEPSNLGAGVNTPKDEWAPTPSADGRRLLFATDGRGGAGKHDLFVATRSASGEWTNTTALPGALNTAVDEFDAAWLADDETIVFARSQDAATQPIALLWSRSENGSYPVGAPFGAEINVVGGWTLGPLRDWKEPDLLYFSSHHADARRGKLDLYAIRVRSTP